MKRLVSWVCILHSPAGLAAYGLAEGGVLSDYEFHGVFAWGTPQRSYL